MGSTTPIPPTTASTGTLKLENCNSREYTSRLYARFYRWLCSHNNTLIYLSNISWERERNLKYWCLDIVTSNNLSWTLTPIFAHNLIKIYIFLFCDGKLTLVYCHIVMKHFGPNEVLGVKKYSKLHTIFGTYLGNIHVYANPCTTATKTYTYCKCIEE